MTKNKHIYLLSIRLINDDTHIWILIFDVSVCSQRHLWREKCAYEWCERDGYYVTHERAIYTIQMVYFQKMTFQLTHAIHQPLFIHTDTSQPIRCIFATISYWTFFVCFMEEKISNKPSHIKQYRFIPQLRLEIVTGSSVYFVFVFPCHSS